MTTIFDVVGSPVISQQLPDITVIQKLDAAGTTLATAPQIPGSSSITVAFVHWVDASNYAVQVPHVEVGDIIEVYTDAPEGQAVSVFWNGAGGILLGTVTAANGKIFRFLGLSGWGSVG